MDDTLVESFYKVLFTTLLANMPRDTLNMVTQTELLGQSDIGTHWKIIITGPMSTHKKGGSGDYAYDVNYNKRRGPKERANYQYVERIIKQTATVFGFEVSL